MTEKFRVEWLRILHPLFNRDCKLWALPNKDPYWKLDELALFWFRLLIPEIDELYAMSDEELILDMKRNGWVW